MNITVFHNGSTLPVSDSVELNSDPVAHFGEPDQVVGSLSIWNCGELRIVVSHNVLTTAP